MMHAVVMRGHGGPQALHYGQLPVPAVSAGQVLVRVYGAGVNPVDWKIRDGFGHPWLDRPDPGILGFDLSGVVQAVGHEVRRFTVGQSVYGCTSIRRNGAYAEYVVASESELAHKPESIDFVDAAAVPTVGLTAWRGLFDLAHLVAGQRVLVHGAAGGVGSMAVQLAKWAGAHVTGVASGRNEQYCRALGADDYIDYTAVAFEEAGYRDFDVVIDTIGGDYKLRSLAVLKKGGILVAMIDPLKHEIAEEHGVRTGMVKVHPDGSRLEKIAQLIDQGALKVHVQAVLPLSQFAQAHELSQSGRTRGKIVLVPDALWQPPVMSEQVVRS